MRVNNFRTASNCSTTAHTVRLGRAYTWLKTSLGKPLFVLSACHQTRVVLCLLCKANNVNSQVVFHCTSISLVANAFAWHQSKTFSTGFCSNRSESKIAWCSVNSCQCPLSNLGLRLFIEPVCFLSPTHFNVCTAASFEHAYDNFPRIPVFPARALFF